ncbi:hypothetical protein HY989_04370 [Candidatus Micrarchaeota archaeon]|nr:hypothetical protein [Candidatus Micrarchaeota archaeon]
MTLEKEKIFRKAIGQVEKIHNEAKGPLSIDELQPQIKTLMRVGVEFLIPRYSEINSTLEHMPISPKYTKQRALLHAKAKVLYQAIELLSLNRGQPDGKITPLNYVKISKTTGRHFDNYFNEYLDNFYVRKMGGLPLPVRVPKPGKLAKDEKTQETLGKHTVASLQEITEKFIGNRDKFEKLHSSDRRLLRFFAGKNKFGLDALAKTFNKSVPEIGEKLAGILLRHYKFNVHKKEE